MVPGEPDDRLVTGLSLPRHVVPPVARAGARAGIDYDRLRGPSRPRPARQGRYLGIGFATFIEAAPGPAEMRPGGGLFGGEQARVRLEADGHLVVITAQAPHGQGHETTLAQIAADEMGVPFEHVRVVHGDTGITPFSLIGTGGSRAATWASGAVLSRDPAGQGEGARHRGRDARDQPGRPRDRRRRRSRPKGVPHEALPLAEIATQVYLMARQPPAGHRRVRSRPTSATPARHHRQRLVGRHPRLHGRGRPRRPGAVKILRYVVVEDCGR